MKTPGSMLLAATLMGAAALAVVTPAAAADRISDAAYMSAARCAGLAEGAKLDTASVTKLLDAQRGGRDFYIQDKADEMRREAARSVQRAGEAGKQRLTAELGGSCKAFLGSGTTVANVAVAR